MVREMKRETEGEEEVKLSDASLRTAGKELNKKTAIRRPATVRSTGIPQMVHPFDVQARRLDPLGRVPKAMIHANME